jgi:hypothetical protein
VRFFFFLTTTGEVESGGVVATALYAKWVGDADVAARPGAVVSDQPGACCRSWPKKLSVFDHR